MDGLLLLFLLVGWCLVAFFSVVVVDVVVVVFLFSVTRLLLLDCGEWCASGVGVLCHCDMLHCLLLFPGDLKRDSQRRYSFTGRCRWQLRGWS